MYTCRECDREINQATEVCPYCGADLTVPAAAEGGAPPASDGSGQKKPKLLAALARWGVLLGAMLLFVWFILLLPGPSSRDAGRQAETRALEALEKVQAALAGYAAVRGGEFPPSLESLGDPALRDAARAAQSEGYRLTYQPGPPDPDGVVRRYGLEARAGHHGYRSFYTDPSGAIRATRENRPATEHDPPIE